MPADHVGPFPLDGVTLETWLIEFDKAGNCTAPQTRQQLLARIKAAQDVPVIVFSHGWNNEFRDANHLYSAFLQQLEVHLRRGTPGPRPLFVGIIWPSTWLSFDTGPGFAAAGGMAEQGFQRELAEALPDDAQRQRFDQLAGQQRLGESAAREFAALLAGALKAQPVRDDVDAREAGARIGDTLLAGAQALAGRERANGSGQGDEARTIGGSGEFSPPQDASLLDVLDPRRLLRVASVYQMKDRAGTVGWNGVSPLISDILAVTKAPVHLVGHSFGSKVMLSALAARELPEKPASVLLLEPAISYLCFAGQVPGQAGHGGYQAVLQKTKQPIIITYSAHDVPLHELFHLALRRSSDPGEVHTANEAPTGAGQPPNQYAALGGYGPRGAGQVLAEPLPGPDDAPIEFPSAGVPLAFDGTRDDRIKSHGDVATKYTTWLLYSQMVRKG